MNKKEDILNEIWRLNVKAEQTRSIQGMIKQRLKRWSIFFNLYISLGSAISAMFIFSPWFKGYEIYVGFFSASLFLISTIPAIMGFNKMVEERNVAVTLWGNWIRDAQNFGNLEINNLNQQEAEIEQKKLLEDYKTVMEKTVQIKDKQFVKFKQRHKQKVEISKVLDKSPFLKLREIKKDFKKRDKLLYKKQETETQNEEEPVKLVNIISNDGK